MDEGGPRQPVATGRPALHFHDLEQEPRNRLRVDEVGVGRGEGRPRPDGAGVLRVLPDGAGRALLHRVPQVGVGAEEVGDDLHLMVIEQGSLRLEECPGAVGG